MRVSRRGFVVSLAAALPYAKAAEANRGRNFPSVAARYLDPATEFTVIRLTDPQYSSFIPAPHNRVLTPKALVYASNQTGRWEAFRMDLKTREFKQITDAAALEPASIALTPNDKGFWHFDGGKLMETSFSGWRMRELYKVPDGSEKTPGVSFSDDGQHAAIVEQANGRYRLKVLQLAKGAAAAIFEGPQEIHSVLIRPKHGSVSYRVGSEVRSIEFDGRQSQPMGLAAGEIGQTLWSADGRSLFYLNRAPDTRATTLREYQPEGESGSPTDRLVARTSQFVRFSANGDASVFVGASGSAASPYILLLTHVAKRELTLAEHRATDPAVLTPVFSPNSQFVVFGSNRHGKPAIYWMSVDKFVSDTEGS